MSASCGELTVIEGDEPPDDGGGGGGQPPADGDDEIVFGLTGRQLLAGLGLGAVGVGAAVVASRDDDDRRRR